jgi:transmembrane sensor
MTNHVSGHDGSANAPDWDAIARYLAGESPDAEAVVVRRWLEAHPEDERLVERLNAAAIVEAPNVDVEAALRGVHDRMGADISPPAPVLKVERGGNALWSRHRFLIGSGLVAAAAVIVAFVTIRRGPAIAPEIPDGGSRMYVTTIGQRDSVVLADGSRVILGPDSRLMVPNDYSLATRKVVLIGDAYFDVHHDVAKPFSVRVGPATIEDVGTTFTIDSDAGDTTSVSVISGSVRLRANDASPLSGAVLGAGDRGSMTADGNVHAYPHAAVADDSAWTTGRLVFHDASLTRVAGEIHRWFGVTVHVADTSLLDRHVTASFNGESVDQVLKIVGLTLGARVDRQGDSAMVYSSRGPVAPR